MNKSQKVQPLDQQVLDNFQNNTGVEYGIVTVILVVDSIPFVRRIKVLFGDTAVDFFNTIAEWVQVEMVWHCEDSKMNEDTMKEIIAAVTPTIFVNNPMSQGLTPLTEELYQKVRISTDLTDNQFVFVDAGMDQESVAKLLLEKGK